MDEEYYPRREYLARVDALHGLGWEDLRVRYGISEREARAVVLGKSNPAPGRPLREEMV